MCAGVLQVPLSSTEQRKRSKIDCPRMNATGIRSPLKGKGAGGFRMGGCKRSVTCLSITSRYGQPFWEQYEQQRQEALKRAEQERQQQERQREQRREQQREQRKRRQAQKKAEQKQKSAYQPIKKPATLAEAFRILKLKPPVTRAEIIRAFRVQAQVAHPDHGGNHAAMVVLNAAYELALASA